MSDEISNFRGETAVRAFIARNAKSWLADTLDENIEHAYAALHELTRGMFDTQALALPTWLQLAHNWLDSLSESRLADVRTHLRVHRRKDAEPQSAKTLVDRFVYDNAAAAAIVYPPGYAFSQGELANSAHNALRAAIAWTPNYYTCVQPKHTPVRVFWLRRAMLFIAGLDAQTYDSLCEFLRELDTQRGRRHARRLIGLATRASLLHKFKDLSIDKISNLTFHKLLRVAMSDCIDPIKYSPADACAVRAIQYLLRDYSEIERMCLQEVGGGE